MCQEPRTGRGFTLVELLVVLVVIALLASFATVGLVRLRLNAAEAAAIHALRTIHSAQDAFRATCGHGRDYAAALPQLGAANTISSDLAAEPVVHKSRYAITIAPTAPGQGPDACTNSETAAHWYATAVPDGPASSGLHGFATTDSDDLWQDASGAAPPLPFVPNERVSRVGRY